MTAKTDLDRAIEVAEGEADKWRKLRDVSPFGTKAILVAAAKAETASLIAARLCALKEESKG